VEAVQALDTADLLALTSRQVQALTSAQVQAIEALEVAALGTEGLSRWGSAQIAALTEEQLNAMTTEQVAGLTTRQMAALTNAQIESLGSDFVAAIATDDLASLSFRQVAAFTGDQLDAMSDAQIEALAAATPIVLDLDGDGISTLGVDEGVQFDINATGRASKVGWVGGGDGLLAMDRDGDGAIGDGSELFGSATRLNDGRRASHGFEALSDLDGNRDGRIDAQDDAFADLRVWVDHDRDGMTDTGELKGLLDAGVAAIRLDFAQGDQLQHGNLMGLLGTYETTDGEQRQAVDVWFSTRSSEGTTPTAAELLTEAPGTVLLGSDAIANAPAGAASPPTAAGPGQSAGGLTIDEEWLKNQPPLI
jgi:hypothetical protein